MGNIVIARIQTADEAPQALKRIQTVLLGVDQANAGLNVKGHVRAGLDADHASVLRLHGAVNEVNELLRLAGTVCPIINLTIRDHSFVYLRLFPEQYTILLDQMAMEKNAKFINFYDWRGSFSSAERPQLLIAGFAQKGEHVLLIRLYTGLVKGGIHVQQVAPDRPQA